MNVLLTGGMGYIGSHITLSLLESKHEVTILDNLSNSNIEVLSKLKFISSKEPNFVRGDILDTELVIKTLKNYKINAVIHLAGLKAVSESVLYPFMYYKNNVQGAISLLEAMKSCNISNLVFSSSATVYGVPHFLPINEEHPNEPNNPYGRSKFYIEEILSDLVQSNYDWNFVSLRYFNPVGSHASGLIGDNPNGIPNNLMPYINQVASGQYPFLKIFGNDYDTPDGTGIRDYIHVEDLSDAHLSALDSIDSNSNLSKGILNIFNIGTGVGYSVLEIVKAYEKINKLDIPYEIFPRRDGDIASSYADPKKANSMLKWKAKKSIEEMCFSAWNFQKKEPVEFIREDEIPLNKLFKKPIKP
jgi:UDP-glucose 4-epimerase